jgi:DNA (cytosine-5)-methyltransferase 1
VSAIPIVDVFAGPGGLNEGFSSLLSPDGSPIFRSIASFEMDPFACATLRLRAAIRGYRLEHGKSPEAYERFLRSESDFASLGQELSHEVEAAESEIHQIELGPQTHGDSDDLLRRALTSVLQRSDDKWILVGGPPCQAYSLAGRSRRTSDPTFADDHKHTLYREYLAILRKFAPPIFVMENVKGMLSSRHEGGAIFQRIMEDLRKPRSGLSYDIRSFAVNCDDPDSGDFVIRSEEYGVPQRRHRVILLGVRSDLGAPHFSTLQRKPLTTVAEAIEGLPSIRSQISPRSHDSTSAWKEVRIEAWSMAGSSIPDQADVPPIGTTRWSTIEHRRLDGDLASWLVDPGSDGVSLHQSRSHMVKDLWRYGYMALMAEQGIYPKVGDLPAELVPAHKNALRFDAPFADRFRVQRWSDASTTVVSHISKDGHYYIHPDPQQMRSLTVREAARLQTFPDDYFFVGNRTQQYHQVGNAVPPLLARQLGEVVAEIVGAKVGVGRL